MRSTAMIKQVPMLSYGSIRGRGAYSYSRPGPVGKAGRVVGRALGQHLGGPLGGHLGEAAGGLAHYIGRIFGSGDYVTNLDRLKQNTIVNDAQIPQFGTGSNVVRIRHREFLGDIISSATAGAFNITSYAINPGLALSLPWLSQVCGATFQQYRINGMIFEFRSMSADALNNVNTALGSVVMATDYDSADAVFTSKAQMENTEFGVSCKPSCSMLHGIECARNQTSISEPYIRAGAVPTNADIRMYDWGRFSIATVGLQGTNVNCGELWCSYDITLLKAIQQPPGYLIPFSYYALTGADATHPFGTSQAQWQTYAGAAPNQIDITFNSANRFSFPASTPLGSHFRVNWNLQGAAAAALTPPVLSTGNGLYFSGQSEWQTGSNTVETLTWTFDVQYSGPATPGSPPYVNLANFTWAPAGGVVQADLYITQLSGLSPGPFANQ